MNKLTIAHLSDLHISKSTIKDQQIILNALFSDLQTKYKMEKNSI